LTVVRGRLILAVLLPLLLIAAVGLAAGVLDSPARLYIGPSNNLSWAPITLPTIVIAGLADGINPCAFTILLLFAAAIASIYGGIGGTGSGAMRARLFLYGGTFILAIFVTYLILGTGLLRASTALTQNHIGARLGALAAVFLGLWMIKDYFVPGWGPRLSAPVGIGKLIHTWGQRASLTAMFGLGGLVGLCTVPCSGAVYLVVLSMLALQPSFIQSYLYLVLYNIMFVVPLVAILVAASARPALHRLAYWNSHYRERVRLILGSSVVLLGLGILATV
jgi:cytochrome c biogenesis protein CcdA